MIKSMKLLIPILVLVLIGCGQGPKGDPGQIGLPGSPGDSVVGPVGPAGADGTVITPVQFCQGIPSYPSTFLEVGFVINNKVYGVYSTHGGFMTYLPPGAYSSDTVGSHCNFTINSDNTISN